MGEKAALSARRGRCGDVVTGKRAGCVSKQELWLLSDITLIPRFTSPLTTTRLSQAVSPTFPPRVFITGDSLPRSARNTLEDTRQNAICRGVIRVVKRSSVSRFALPH